MSLNSGTVTIFRQLARQIGTELPAPIAEAVEAAASLRRADLSAATDSSNLGHAVAEAVRAGRDPLTSKAVQRALTADQLRRANIGDRLAALADQEVLEALTEHATAMIESWRPAVEDAQAALDRFRAAAPEADLADIHVASSLPPNALTPWGQARDAAARLDDIGKAWTMLADATRVAYLPNGTRPLIFADLDLDQLEELGRNPKAGKVAYLEDVQLDLATPEVLTDRVARITEARSGQEVRRANAPKRARQEAAQRATGSKVTVP